MRKLFALIALAAAVFTACEGDNEVNLDNLKIKLSSDSVMSFGVDGGEGVITYEFEEISDATRAKMKYPAAEAATAVDWITDLTVHATSLEVTFNVAANEGGNREATIKVWSGDHSFMVMVKQEGHISADVNFNASYVGGTFYGKFINGEKQTEGFNYFVILSDTQPESIYTVPQYATEYRFDIYADKSAEFNSELRIPVGTYTLDHQRTGRVGTIDAHMDCSYYYSSSNVATSFKTCTLTVTEESIVADITLLNGETHRVVYSGEPVMCDYSQPTYADVYPVSQYTSTVEFDVTGGYMYAYFRGDWFGTGNDVWFMHMIETKAGFSGVYMLFNFIVPKSAGGYSNQTGFVGEYKLSDPTQSLDYTFPAGRLRDDSQQLNAWYLYCVNGQIDMSKAAPIKDGTIKVESVDGDTVITVDGIDDAGNAIKGTFRGIVHEMVDQSQY